MQYCNLRFYQSCTDHNFWIRDREGSIGIWRPLQMVCLYETRLNDRYGYTQEFVHHEGCWCTLKNTWPLDCLWDLKIPQHLSRENVWAHGRTWICQSLHWWYFMHHQRPKQCGWNRSKYLREIFYSLERLQDSGLNVSANKSFFGRQVLEYLIF